MKNQFDGDESRLASVKFGIPCDMDRKLLMLESMMNGHLVIPSFLLRLIAVWILSWGIPASAQQKPVIGWIETRIGQNTLYREISGRITCHSPNPP